MTGLLLTVAPSGLTAFAANLTSALYGAVGMALLVWFLGRLRVGAASCVVAALALAVGRTLWSQAVVAEVYTFDLLLAVAALATVAHAFGSGRTAWFCAGLIVGLWIGHRWINAAYAPGVALVAWGVSSGRGASPRRDASSRRDRSPDQDIIALPAFLLGCAVSTVPYAYLPLASSTDPPIDIGDPERLDRFLAVVTSAPYFRHLSGGGGFAGARILSYVKELPHELGVLAFAVPIGIWHLARRPRGSWITAGCLLITAACLGLTSRYDIPDIRSYFLPSFVSLGLLGAVGTHAALSAVGRRRPGAARAAAACLVVVAAIGLPVHLGQNDLRRERTARLFAEHALECAGTNAVIFVAGDTAAHTLWYLQAVEGTRTDAVVVSMGHWSQWYFDELAQRFPEDRWPEYGPGTEPVTHFGRLLVSLSARRPVFFALDPAPLAPSGDAWWAGRTVVPVGLLTEARDRELPFDRDGLATWNSAFWERATRALGPPRAAADQAVKALYVEYALGLSRCGDFATRQGMASAARRLYEAALALEPDRWEDEIARGRQGASAGPQVRAGEQALRGLRALDTGG